MVLDPLGNVLYEHDVEHISDPAGGAQHLASFILESLAELGAVKRLGDGPGVNWVDDAELQKVCRVYEKDNEITIFWSPSFLALGSARATRPANLQNFVIAFL